MTVVIKLLPVHTVVIDDCDDHMIRVENVEWIFGQISQSHFELSRLLQYVVVNG